MQGCYFFLEVGVGQRTHLNTLLGTDQPPVGNDPPVVGGGTLPDAGHLTLQVSEPHQKLWLGDLSGAETSVSNRVPGKLSVPALCSPKIATGKEAVSAASVMATTVGALWEGSCDPFMTNQEWVLYPHPHLHMGKLKATNIVPGKHMEAPPPHLTSLSPHPTELSCHSLGPATIAALTPGSSG